MENSKNISPACATLCVLGAGVLWGLISLFVRELSAAGLSSFQISGIRVIVGAVGMLLVLLLTDRAKLKIRARDIWMFIGTGVVSLTLFNVFYFMCIQLSEASIAVVLLYTSPIWVTLMSAVLFKEGINAIKLVALAMTICGSALVAGLAGGVSLTPLALGAGLASGLFYALYSIFARVALARYDTMTVTFYTFLTAAICSLFISDIGGIAQTMASQPSIVAVGLGIGVFCTIAPFLLYTLGLSNMETGRAAILAMAEPLVGTLLGIFIYHESAGPLKLLGIALIFASIALLNIKTGKASKKHDELA